VIQHAEGQDNVEFSHLVYTGLIEVEKEGGATTGLHGLDVFGSAIGRCHIESELSEGVTQVAKPCTNLEDPHSAPLFEVYVRE
jgi:hypothetical protein